MILDIQLPLLFPQPPVMSLLLITAIAVLVHEGRRALNRSNSPELHMGSSPSVPTRGKDARAADDPMWQRQPVPLADAAEPAMTPTPAPYAPAPVAPPTDIGGPEPAAAEEPTPAREPTQLAAHRKPPSATALAIGAALVVLTLALFLAIRAAGRAKSR